MQKIIEDFYYCFIDKFKSKILAIYKNKKNKIENSQLFFILFTQKIIHLNNRVV